MSYDPFSTGEIKFNVLKKHQIIIGFMVKFYTRLKHCAGNLHLPLSTEYITSFPCMQNVPRFVIRRPPERQYMPYSPLHHIVLLRFYSFPLHFHLFSKTLDVKCVLYLMRCHKRLSSLITVMS